MKVLFLDFDGVLNSDKFLRKSENKGAIVDPKCMVLLKQIIDETNAKIVLSTSWREHWEQNAEKCDETGRLINRIFEDFEMSVFQKTPLLNTNREAEIKAWLDGRNDVENFVVLDDRVLSAPFLNSHFVKTSNSKGGLDEEGVKKAVLILDSANGGEI